MTEKNKIEVVKLQYEALLTEYRMLREMVSNSRQLQGQTDNIALAMLGVSIPIILAILNQSLYLVGVILLLPILFFAIASSQIRHEHMLLNAAMYVDAELRPKIDNLLTSISSEKVELFQWESFLSHQIGAPNLLGLWIAICARASVGLGAGLGIIGIYVFIHFFQTSGPMQFFESLLIAVNCLLLFLDLALAFRIALKRYLYLKKIHHDTR
jgi:hypothetical protein